MGGGGSPIPRGGCNSWAAPPGPGRSPRPGRRRGSTTTAPGGKGIAPSPRAEALPAPEPPTVVDHDGSGEHAYALVAVGPQGRRSPASRPVRAGGLARLRWGSVPGADAYLVERDGRVLGGPIRREGSEKE